MSSQWSASYPGSSVNNNERAGTPWGSGGGWNGAQYNVPEWAQILFNGSKTINKVVVYSVQDNYTNPIEPLDTTTFSMFGVVNFTVEGWNDASWSTLATVTGNNVILRVPSLFTQSFAGPKKIYMRSMNIAGFDTGFQEKGTWNVPGT